MNEKISNSLLWGWFIMPLILGIYLSISARLAFFIMAIVCFPIYLPISGLLAIRQRRQGNSMYFWFICLVLASVVIAICIYYGLLIILSHPND